jgi:hypothetical protein
MHKKRYKPKRASIGWWSPPLHWGGGSVSSSPLSCTPLRVGEGVKTYPSVPLAEVQRPASLQPGNLLLPWRGGGQSSACLFLVFFQNFLFGVIIVVLYFPFYKENNGGGRGGGDPRLCIPATPLSPCRGGGQSSVCLFFLFRIFYLGL